MPKVQPVVRCEAQTLEELIRFAQSYNQTIPMRPMVRVLSENDEFGRESIEALRSEALTYVSGPENDCPVSETFRWLADTNVQADFFLYLESSVILDQSLDLQQLAGEMPEEVGVLVLYIPFEVSYGGPDVEEIAYPLGFLVRSELVATTVEHADNWVKGIIQDGWKIRRADRSFVQHQRRSDEKVIHRSNRFHGVDPTEVDEIFGPGYYPEYYDPKYVDTRHRALGDVLVGAFRPGSAIDAGCGAGGLIRVMLGWGVDALGIDGSVHARKAASNAAPLVSRRIELHDLRLPFDIDQVDLVVCWETLEYIAPQDANAVVEQLCRMASRSVVVGLSKNDVRGQKNAFGLAFWHHHFWLHHFHLNVAKTQKVEESLAESGNALDVRIGVFDRRDPVEAGAVADPLMP